MIAISSVVGRDRVSSATWRLALHAGKCLKGSVSLAIPFAGRQQLHIAQAGVSLLEQMKHHALVCLLPTPWQQDNRRFASTVSQWS